MKHVYYALVILFLLFGLSSCHPESMNNENTENSSLIMSTIDKDDAQAPGTRKS